MTTSALVTPKMGFSGPVPGTGRVESIWSTIHSNFEATAATAAELIRPFTFAGSSVSPAKVPEGASRCIIRAFWSVAGAVTTSPVVRVYGTYGPINSSDWFADDATVQPIRLDRYATGAGGVTVTLDATNDLRDTTYSYSAPLLHADTGLPFLDCLGCSYVFALCSTAGNVVGTGGLQIAFLN